jgi:hypothetical protein
VNHPIAQFVALTCHANAFLRGRVVRRFFPTNSTCTFCDRVRFVGLSKTLLGLLDAGRSAWVFGGMGSWNDLAFHGEVQAEYGRTSERLLLTLTEVIQAAANASCAAGG